MNPGAALLGPTRSFKVESDDLKAIIAVHYSRHDTDYIEEIYIKSQDTCADPQLRAVRREQLKGTILKLKELCEDQFPPAHVEYMNRDDLAATLDALSDGSAYSHLITEGQIQLGPFNPVDNTSQSYWEDCKATFRLDTDCLLSSPTELSINGVTVALDSVERAEWSLCESDAERDDYPRWMLEQRSSHAASNAQNPGRDSNGEAGSELREEGEGERGQESAEVQAVHARDRVEECIMGGTAKELTATEA